MKRTRKQKRPRTHWWTNRQWFDSKHQLTRSASNRLLGGVLGGIAQYFKWNATAVRVIYLILTALTNFIPGIVIYVVLYVTMPPDPEQQDLWSFLTKQVDLDHWDWKKPGQPRQTLTDVEEHDVKSATQAKENKHGR